MLKMGKTKLSIKSKVQIAEELCAPGISISALSRKYDVSRAAIHKIKLKSAEIIQYYEENVQKATDQVQVNRKGKYPCIDAALLSWFYKMRNEKIPLSYNILQHKAKELASNFGETDFTASNGWLRRWLK